MHTPIRVVAAVLALLGALTACSRPPAETASRVTDATAGLPRPTSSTSTTSTTMPDLAPGPLADPGEPGPAGVGRSTFTVTDPDRDGRSLEVDIWYPAAPDATGEASSYRLPGDVGISARALAEPEAATGPFPLVVFSHAGAGMRFQSFSLVERLASHGFVVVAPDHAGNTAADEIAGRSVPFDEVAVDRPLDVSLVIDQVLERSATPDDLLAGRVDPGSVGVVGHSLGGFTALAVGGGTDSVEADERVAAIVPIAPMSSLLSDDNLGAVRIPTLLIGGTADTTTPIVDASTRPFDLVGSDVVRRVDVAGATHWSFSDICQLEATLRFVDADPMVERPFAANAVGACAPDVVPAEQVNRLLSHYVVAFLKAHLADDERYTAHLEPVVGAEVHVR